MLILPEAMRTSAYIIKSWNKDEISGRGHHLRARPPGGNYKTRGMKVEPGLEAVEIQEFAAEEEACQKERRRNVERNQDELLEALVPGSVGESLDHWAWPGAALPRACPDLQGLDSGKEDKMEKKEKLPWICSRYLK